MPSHHSAREMARIVSRTSHIERFAHINASHSDNRSADGTLVARNNGLEHLHHLTRTLHRINAAMKHRCMSHVVAVGTALI